jgi:hypothetical protein
VRASDLLTIDVAAELRRLSEATLEGPWQVPTELVRRALAAGARRVTVELRRNRVVVRDDGAPLPPESERDLRRLLDTALPPSQRHDALVALEAEPTLLAVAALAPSRVDVSRGASAGTTLAIETDRLDAAAARRHLVACARFAPAAVVVDGKRVAGGFISALAERPLSAPLSGRLALTGDEIAHLWLLAQGMVTSHLTLPDMPAFEAAIELAPASGLPTPAALREAAQPHLASLVDQAVELLLETVARPDIDDALRRLLRSRLLVAARHGFRQAEIFRVPMVPALLGPEGTRSRLLSLVDVGAGRPVACLGPADDVTAHLLPSGPVLVLDEQERGQLASLLNLRFRPLQRQRVPSGPAARARRMAVGLGDGLRRAFSSIRHPGGGEVITEPAQSADEREFLRALRSALPADAPRILLTDGGGLPHIAADGLRLPRRHRDVTAAIHAVAREPARAYVALIALGRGLSPTPEAAASWRRTFSD